MLTLQTDTFSHGINVSYLPYITAVRSLNSQITWLCCLIMALKRRLCKKQFGCLVLVGFTAQQQSTSHIAPKINRKVQIMQGITVVNERKRWNECELLTYKCINVSCKSLKVTFYEMLGALVLSPNEADRTCRDWLQWSC